MREGLKQAAVQREKPDPKGPRPKWNENKVPLMAHHDLLVLGWYDRGHIVYGSACKVHCAKLDITGWC